MITGAFALFFSTRDHSSGTALDSRFILFILAWGITLISSPVILFLRLLRVIPERDSFLYILTGTINCFVGLYGLTELLSLGFSRDVYQEMVLLLFDVLMAAFVFVDAFVREIPGLRGRHARMRTIQEG